MVILNFIKLNKLGTVKYNKNFTKQICFRILIQCEKRGTWYFWSFSSSLFGLRPRFRKMARIRICGIYHETSSLLEKRRNARYLKRFGCAVRGIVERIYHPTRDLRETRLSVIRVKEKEVSARMRTRIGGGRGDETEGETEWRTRTRGWGRIREKFGRGHVKYWQRETAIFTGDAPDTKAGLLYMVMVLGLREIMCLLSRVGGRYATFNGRRELRTVSTRTQYKHSADIAVCNIDFVINHSQIYLYCSIYFFVWNWILV